VVFTLWDVSRWKLGKIMRDLSQAKKRNSSNFGVQPELDFGGKRNPDRQGYSAFGKVAGGMDIVRKIHQQPKKGQMLVLKVKIFNIVRFK
jgi:cyclophilin family peptidyl-prolyl cis-trans isomerase